MIFKNGRYFSRQTFELLKSSLRIDRRNLFDAIEYEVSLEQIHNKKKVLTTFNHGLLVTAFFFFVFGLLFQIGPNDELTLIAISLALILSVIAFSTRKKLVIIETYDGDNIQLYFTNRNKRQVIDFADQVINVSNLYLLNKYGKIDLALPVDAQLNNIQFLRNREVLSEEDYETLKNRLLRRENQTAVGFGFNN